MKKTFLSRTLAFVLVLALVMSTLVTVPTSAKAAEHVRLFIPNYDMSVTAREGEAVSSLIKRLKPTVKVQIGEETKTIFWPTVKEKGYVHANKNNKFKLTFYYGNAQKVLTVKVKEKTRKLTAKATGKPLYEGQILTPTMANRVANIKNLYTDGKVISKFKGYDCSQIGKKIKSNKKGKTKLIFRNGKKKASCMVKVIPIKRIYVEHTVSELLEGTFDEAEFRAKTTLKAIYTNGMRKSLTTYSIIASDVVKGTSFPITIKQDNKFICKLNIPVVRKQNPNPNPNPPPTPTPTPIPDKEYTVKVNIEGEGEVTLDSEPVNSKTVKDATKVDFGAKPNSGWKFVGWKLDGKRVSEDNPYTRAITSDITLVAVFEEEAAPIVKHTVTLSIEGEGSVTIDEQEVDSLEVEDGAEVSPKANPEAGWKFVGWKLDGELVSEDNPYTRAITSDITLVAVFEEEAAPVVKHTVTLSIEGEGTVTMNGKEETSLQIEDNGELTSEANPAEGWELEGWKLDGKDEIISRANPFKKKVTSDIALVAVFKERTEFQLGLFETGGEGTISLDDEEILLPYSKVLKKGNYTAKAQAKEGYRFVQWNDENGEFYSKRDIITIDLSKDMAFTAVYEEVHELTVFREGKGSVTANDQLLVFKDGVATKKDVAGVKVLVAEPAANYQFSEWTDEEGKQLSTDPTLTLDLTENRTIKAVFKAMYTLNVGRTPGSDLKVTVGETTLTGDSASFQYLEGTKVKVKVSDTTEWRFAWVTDQNTSTKLSTERNFEIELNSNMDIMVVAEEVFKVTVIREGAPGFATLDKKALEFSDENVATMYLPMGQYPLDVELTDDYIFVSGEMEDGRIITGLSHIISVISNMTIKLKFREADKTVSVTYRRNNGQQLRSEAVPFGGTLEPPTEDMNIQGMFFVGWMISETGIVYKGAVTDSDFFDTSNNKLSDAIKGLTAQKKDVDIVAVYENKAIDDCFVQVTDGFMKTGNTLLDSGTLVKAGTLLTLDTIVPEGKYFAGWYNKANGELQGQTKEYSCHIHGDIHFEARFSDVEVEIVPRVFFFGEKLRIDTEAGNFAFFMKYDIPEEYEIVERGLLVLTKSIGQTASEEEMTLEKIKNNENPNLKKLICPTSNSEWENTSKLPTGDLNKHLRLYAVVKGVEGEETLYSEVISLYD